MILEIYHEKGKKRKREDLGKGIVEIFGNNLDKNIRVQAYFLTKWQPFRKRCHHAATIENNQGWCMKMPSK